MMQDIRGSSQKQSQSSKKSLSSSEGLSEEQKDRVEAMLGPRIHMDPNEFSLMQVMKGDKDGDQTPKSALTADLPWLISCLQLTSFEDSGVALFRLLPNDSEDYFESSYK